MPRIPRVPKEESTASSSSGTGDFSSLFNTYPRHFKGDNCDMQIGSSGAMSYVINGRCHYPHITVGNEDVSRSGFHVSIGKGKHIFFKSTTTFPYCEPVVFDRVSTAELWSVFNYSKEFAMELQAYRESI